MEFLNGVEELAGRPDSPRVNQVAYSGWHERRKGGIERRTETPAELLHDGACDRANRVVSLAGHESCNV